MSPAPHVPAPPRALTKNRRLAVSGVGQKSAAAELTGAGRWTAGPQGAVTLARRNDQMSLGSVSPPTAPGRVDAMYSSSPLGVSIGQPSACALLMPTSRTAGPHWPNVLALAVTGAPTSNASRIVP